MAMTKNDMAPPQNEMRPLKTTITVAVSGTTTPMISANRSKHDSENECCDEREEGYADEVCDKMVFTHNVAPP